MGDKFSLSYKIKDVDLDIEVSIIPKEPTLAYKLVVENSGMETVKISSLKAKITILGVTDNYKGTDITVLPNEEVEIEINKKLDNLIDFGNSVFNYFVKTKDKSKYKIRGLAKINGELYRVKGSSKKESK